MGGWEDQSGVDLWSRQCECVSVCGGWEDQSGVDLWSRQCECVGVCVSVWVCECVWAAGRISQGWTFGAP